MVSMFFFRSSSSNSPGIQHSESEKFTDLSKPTGFHLGLATLTTSLNWAPGFFACPWNVTNYHGPQKMIFQDISRVWALRSVHVLSRVSLSSSMFSWWRGTKKKGIMTLRKGVSSLRKSLDHWISFLHCIFCIQKRVFLLGVFYCLARSPVTNSGRKKKQKSKKSPVIAPPVTSQQSQLST